MARSYYKGIKRAMDDQRNRKYGTNKHGDDQFTGRDPHGNPSKKRSFNSTFRNPENRSRLNHDNKRLANYQTPLNGNNSTCLDRYQIHETRHVERSLTLTRKSSTNSSDYHEMRSADRTSPKAYGDAIKIRLLEDENKDLRDDLESSNEKNGDLRDEVSILKDKLRVAENAKDKAENDQLRLIGYIEKSPCRLINGNWVINIGGKEFTADE